MAPKKSVQDVVGTYLESCAILPPRQTKFELLRALEVVADEDGRVKFIDMNMGIDEDFLRAYGISMSDEIKHEMIRTYQVIMKGAKTIIKGTERNTFSIKDSADTPISVDAEAKVFETFFAWLKCWKKSMLFYTLSINGVEGMLIPETTIVEDFLKECVPAFCIHSSIIKTACRRLETRFNESENIEYGFAVVTSYSTGTIDVEAIDGNNTGCGCGVKVPKGGGGGKAEIARNFASEYSGTGVIGARVYYVHVKKNIGTGIFKVEEISAVTMNKDEILKTTLTHNFAKGFMKMGERQSGSSLREEVQGAPEVHIVTSGITPTSTDLVQLRKDLIQGVKDNPSLVRIKTGDDSTGTQEVLLSPEDSKMYDTSALSSGDADNNSNNMLYKSSLDELKKISKAIEENGTISVQGTSINGIMPVIHCTMPDSLPIIYRPDLSGTTESGKIPNWVHREKDGLSILVRVQRSSGSGNSGIVTVHNNTDWHVREFVERVKNNNEAATERIKELEGQGFFRLHEDEADDEKKAAAKSGAIVMMGRQLLALKREAVMAAVEKDGQALQYASDEMRADEEVVRAAVNQNADALQYASKELQGDEEMRSYAANKMKSQKS